MALSAVGAALAAEIGLMIAYVASYDPSDYVKSKRNAEDSWYVRLYDAFDQAELLGLVSNPAWDRTHAIADTNEVIENMIDRFGTLPILYTESCMGTAYTGDVTSTLADDLNNAIASGIAGTKLKTISAYVRISQANIAAYVNLLNLGKGSRSVVTVSNNPYGASMDGMLKRVVEDGGSFAGDVVSKTQNDNARSMGLGSNYSTGFDANFGDET